MRKLKTFIKNVIFLFNNDISKRTEKFVFTVAGTKLVGVLKNN